jgi:hypothetical protein
VPSIVSATRRVGPGEQPQRCSLVVAHPDRGIDEPSLNIGQLLATIEPNCDLVLQLL